MWQRNTSSKPPFGCLRKRGEISNKYAPTFGCCVFFDIWEMDVKKKLTEWGGKNMMIARWLLSNVDLLRVFLFSFSLCYYYLLLLVCYCWCLLYLGSLLKQHKITNIYDYKLIITYIYIYFFLHLFLIFHICFFYIQ